jgi:hypothetical protein
VRREEKERTTLAHIGLAELILLAILGLPCLALGGVALFFLIRSSSRGRRQ